MSGLKPEQLARYLSSVIGERVTLLDVAVLGDSSQRRVVAKLTKLGCALQRIMDGTSICSRMAR
jgi:hypothetical protein